MKALCEYSVVGIKFIQGDTSTILQFLTEKDLLQCVTQYLTDLMESTNQFKVRSSPLGYDVTTMLMNLPVVREEDVFRFLKNFLEKHTAKEELSVKVVVNDKRVSGAQVGPSASLTVGYAGKTDCYDVAVTEEGSTYTVILKSIREPTAAIGDTDVGE